MSNAHEFEAFTPALRRLARGLLHGRDGAEDLVQEAWLAALEKQPGAAFRRPWLIATLRNASFGRLRSEAHRRDREHRSARPEALPSTAESSERIEVFRRLLAAVDGLAEPYRTAVSLRFLEDLPPRAVAKRLGVPVNTVRTQVRRGLEQLRRTLDSGSPRDRDAFLATLAPLASSSLRLIPRPLLMASGALAIALIPTWFARRASAPEPERGSTPLATAAGSAPPSGTALEPAPSARAAAPATGSARAALLSDLVIHGHVTRGAEAPRAGLEVRARRQVGYDASGALLEEASLSTDAAGDFVWTAPAREEPVRVTFECVDADHLGFAESIPLAPGDAAPSPVVLRALPLDAVLEGTVRDAEGAPSVQAHVAVGPLQQTVSDAQGRYRVRIASAQEDIALNARQPGLGATRMWLGPFRSGETRSLDVVLGPELVLRGTVRADTGAPLAGASVFSLRHRWEGAPGATTTSDDQGRFELGLESAPWVNLRIEAPGHVSQDLYGTLPCDPVPLIRSTGPVNVFRGLSPPSFDPEHIEVTLAVGLPLHGIVHDPNGEPVPAALVRDPNGHAHATDPGGRFTVPHAGPEVELLVRRRGHAGAFVTVAVPPAGTTEPVEIGLAPPTPVAGLVLGPDDQPVPFAAIAGTWSDRAGRFALDGLGAEVPHVFVKAPGHADGEFELTDARTDLVLRLAPSACLRGHVRDAISGAPVATFEVSVFSPGDPGRRLEAFPSHWRDGVTFSSPEGAWWLEAAFPPDLEVALAISAPGYAPLQVQNLWTRTPAEAPDLDLALHRTTLVRGRVVDRDTGAGLAGVRLTRMTAAERATSIDDALATRSTDREGFFELAGVPSGPMFLAVNSFHHEDRIDGPFLVDGSAPVERLIELGPGSTLVGWLQGADGTALAGKDVKIHGRNAQGATARWGTRTDEQGRFEFRNLVSGSYRLEWLRQLDSDASNWDTWVPREDAAGRPGHVYVKEAGDLTVPIELGDEQRLEVVLRPRGQAELVGTLGFAGPMPSPVSVTLARLDENDQPTGHGRGTLAEDGRFVVPNLESGRYALTAEAFLDPETHARGTATVEISEAGRATVHVELERGPRR